jgi:soluble lytic murein transglycosylase-like protein
MSGIGQTTAMALGNNNSSALSESDLMRAQLAQNMGQTSDTQIRQMLANQKVIVTLAAGTEFYMVFTKPALPHESSQPLPSANNAGHIQNTSGGQTAGH